MPPRCAGLIQPDEGRRLAELAAVVDANDAIVELGSHTGLSTIWMATTAHAHITAVDPWGDPRPGSDDDPFSLVTGDATLERFRLNLADEGAWPFVTAIRTTSTGLAPLWVQPVGLLFVDAVHTLDGVASDYRAWSGFIPVGGWLALHDFIADPEHPYAGVARAVDEIILPSGRWSAPRITGYLWTAQRVA